MRFLASWAAALCIVWGTGAALAQEGAAGSGQRTCKEAREGLPTQDPLFQLTGKITMKSGVVYDVVQWGKAGVYSQYAMGLKGTPDCTFPFYQIARIELDEFAKRWRMTLLNGYAPPNVGGMYFVNEAGLNALVGAPADPDKTSWLNAVVKEPRFAAPRELSLNPRDIAAIEVLNPLASTPSVKLETAGAVSTRPIFALPTVFTSYPPPNAQRGTLLLFKVEADGALTLTNVFDMAENAGRAKPRVVPGKQEMVWVSEDGQRAAPYWYEVVTFKRDNKAFEGDGRFQCMNRMGQWHDPEGGRNNQGRPVGGYNPCASALTVTDNSGISATANAITTIGTFGLAAVGGGGYQEKRLDRDKLISTLERAVPDVQARLARAAERFRGESAGEGSRGQ